MADILNTNKSTPEKLKNTNTIEKKTKSDLEKLKTQIPNKNINKSTPEKLKNTNTIKMNESAQIILKIIKEAKNRKYLSESDLRNIQDLTSTVAIIIDNQEISLRKLFLSLDQISNDNMSINYYIPWQNYIPWQPPKTISVWSDVAKLLQLYIISEWFSVLNENSTLLQSIDGKFNDSTIQWRDDLLLKIETQDNFLKSRLQELKQQIIGEGKYNIDLQQQRNLSIETVNYPIIEIKSYGEVCYFNLDKNQIYVLSKETKKQIFFNNILSHIWTNSTNWQILDSDVNKTKFKNLFWLMNIINRSRYISQKASDKSANNYNPFYEESLPLWTNEEYVRYNDNNIFKKDKPLIKENNLWKYLWSTYIKGFIEYINMIHQEDYHDTSHSSVHDEATEYKSTY